MTVPSRPEWVSFLDEGTGNRVHLNIVLFRELQPGRTLGYVREVLYEVIDRPAAITYDQENVLEDSTEPTDDPTPSVA